MLEQSCLCHYVVDEAVAIEQLHGGEAVGGDEEVELAALWNGSGEGTRHKEDNEFNRARRTIR